jgi:tRNA:m4X modification enzyme
VNEKINIGEPEDGEDEKFQLKDVPQVELDETIKIVNRLFSEHVADKIQLEVRSHKVLDVEVNNKNYGGGKLRHILQTASVIGIVAARGFFSAKTCFVDLGAGKGNLSFWLSKAIEDESVQDAKVLVIDRASHRHKKDNLIKDRSLVERIRVDIADLALDNLNLHNCETIVGVSKHLCGRATDFALRCLINCKKTAGFLICVCCHHQITYNSFLGRDWLTSNGIDRRTFNILTKMVSWCICGDGRSRDAKRNEIVENGDMRKEKEEIGWKCKRLLDYARVQFLNQRGFDANLSFYVDKSQTLENVCIVGKVNKI